MIIILLLLSLPLHFAFYCNIVDRCVFASFPKTRVSKGLELLHSPEKWASGVGLAFGVPRFEIRNVSSIAKIHKDTMIGFFVGDSPVTLIAQGGNRVHLRSPELSMMMQVNHNGNDVGFSLFIMMTGKHLQREENEVEEWRANNRRWMELVLFALDDPECPPVIPAFQTWRDCI